MPLNLSRRVTLRQPSSNLVVSIICRASLRLSGGKPNMEPGPLGQVHEGNVVAAVPLCFLQ